MASLLQNVRFNFFAFLAGKACAAFVGLLLPRLLGVEKMGVYTAAWGLAALFSVISDLGLAAYLTREVSRDRSRAGFWLSRALAVQFLQVAVAFAALALGLKLGLGRGLSLSLVALAFIPSALASFSGTFSAAFQGLEQFKLNGILATLASLFNALALGLVLFFMPEPAIVFAAAAMSGLLGILLWAMTALRLGLLNEPPKAMDLPGFFRGAMPFALASAANTLYVRVDLAILTLLLGPAALGQYGAAVKMVDLAVPLLGSLAGPLYPRLSASFSVGSLSRGLRYLSALCLPLGVGGTLLATPIMAWIFGSEFAEAGKAFRWTAWVPALIGVHGVLLYAMNALGKTRLIAWIFFLNLALNVGLNFMLVPRFGFEASAALSTLCEAVVLASALGILVSSGIAIEFRRWLWPALPAVLGMGLLLCLLPSPQGWKVPATVALGALAYGILLWALGFMGDEERLHFRRLLGREA